jgi:hypothetical protein
MNIVKRVEDFRFTAGKLPWAKNRSPAAQVA